MRVSGVPRRYTIDRIFVAKALYYRGKPAKQTALTPFASVTISNLEDLFSCHEYAIIYDTHEIR